MLIVPNVVRDAINAKLDVALEKVPAAKADRELFYSQLLEHFAEHGEVADFEIAPRAPVDERVKANRR